MEDLNGMELSRWKTLKRKNSKTFMEKTANAVLAVLAVTLNAPVSGRRK